MGRFRRLAENANNLTDEARAQLYELAEEADKALDKSNVILDKVDVALNVVLLWITQGVIKGKVRLQYEAPPDAGFIERTVAGIANKMFGLVEIELPGKQETPK